jgi:predicted heme/steroid binding protein
MPFLTLDNTWSDLAKSYNQNFNNKPSIPSIRYTNFDDGLIRGGLLNVGISSVRDTARIGKFFASGRGVLFLAKQVGLQLSNPKLEQPSGSSTDFISSLSNNNTRLYNLGLNTLAQIPINAIGGHIIRHGITPVGGVGFLEGDSLSIQGYNYEKIAITNNKNGKNRLTGYLNKIIQNPKGNTELLNYNGGPGSAYGIIGKTVINTTNQRTTLSLVDKNKTVKNIFGSVIMDYKPPIYNGFNILTNDEISKATQASLTSNLETQLSGSILPYNTKISGYNIEKRIGTSTKNNIDSINAITIVNSKVFYDNSKNPNFEVKEKWALYTSGSDISGNFGQDIIKFRIEFLNNDLPTVDKTINTDVLAFRAYLDDFNDGMNAKWSPYRYMGRGEEFYVYEGFTRDISVAFTLNANSEIEMKPIYRKLNYLMSSFTPDYSSGGRMRGNIGYLTVGDYLYRQPGIFTDIKLSGMLDTGWEIGLNENGLANGQYEVPKYIKVVLSFKPIHTFLPRRAKYTNGVKDRNINVPFITPDRKSYPAGGTNTTNNYLD